jgi:hypothetical protein
MVEPVCMNSEYNTPVTSENVMSMALLAERAVLNCFGAGEIM